MVKLLLLISAVLMVLVGHSYSATTVKPHQRQDISKECQKKVESGIIVCWATATKKWNVTDITKMTTKQSCCSEWDIYDCGIPIVKANCDAKDLAIATAQAKEAEEAGAKGKCADFKFHSQACQAKTPDISKECQKKTEPGIKDCLATVYRKWKVIDFTEMTTKQRCCSDWDIIDCGIALYKANCDAKDLALVTEEVENTEKREGNGKCAEYKFHSQACKA